ncbi:uncharacterized protein K452DRAFT_299667 [Aplosporella prunicola CBS 121167]|uniref:Uncharacterized protein n=1 Tax=Aplosporella prunicola CBS 121167 TaxID=1176127 RepID=A0A6A6B8N9_9PEZI|nr:uncharacterized protein K452DRAFT_299667 [Aplosporella prunicola CBS 121167]KAF2140306.1 hypothetical protein K452DRAFT_299667 [Aplosporella prunicola CBS 121167]
MTGDRIRDREEDWDKSAVAVVDQGLGRPGGRALAHLEDTATTGASPRETDQDQGLIVLRARFDLSTAPQKSHNSANNPLRPELTQANNSPHLRLLPKHFLVNSQGFPWVAQPLLHPNQATMEHGRLHLHHPWRQPMGSISKDPINNLLLLTRLNCRHTAHRRHHHRRPLATLCRVALHQQRAFPGFLRTLLGDSHNIVAMADHHTMDTDSGSNKVATTVVAVGDELKRRSTSGYLEVF